MCRALHGLREEALPSQELSSQGNSKFAHNPTGVGRGVGPSTTPREHRGGHTAGLGHWALPGHAGLPAAKHLPPPWQPRRQARGRRGGGRGGRAARGLQAWGRQARRGGGRAGGRGRGGAAAAPTWSPCRWMSFSPAGWRCGTRRSPCWRTRPGGEGEEEERRRRRRRLPGLAGSTSPGARDGTWQSKPGPKARQAAKAAGGGGRSAASCGCGWHGGMGGEASGRAATRVRRRVKGREGPLALPEPLIGSASGREVPAALWRQSVRGAERAREV